MSKNVKFNRHKYLWNAYLPWLEWTIFALFVLVDWKYTRTLTFINVYDTFPIENPSFSVQFSKMSKFIDFNDTFPIEYTTFSVQISKNVKIYRHKNLWNQYLHWSYRQSLLSEC